MNVLSLFDGISCGQIALNKAGIKYDNYYASEIDSNAIKVTQHNFPNTIQLGTVTEIKASDLPQIDLLIGGSPCQGFSIAGKGLNFDDPRSKLFFEYVRLLKELKPKYFLLENVKMIQEYQDVISNELGVKPILINSALVSAQNRKRLYWTNIANIEQPTDKNIFIKDILDVNSDFEWVHKEFFHTGKKYKSYLQYDGSGKGFNSQNYRAYFYDSKMSSLNYSTPHSHKIYVPNVGIRKTTRNEHERLQTIPDNYTSVLPINIAKKAIGNGWTVEVIAHILKNIKEM